MRHLCVILALFAASAASSSQTTEFTITNADYELRVENARTTIRLVERTDAIPVSERGIHKYRGVSDSAYSETYKESVLVVDDTANRTLDPMPQSGVKVTFKVKSIEGGARQSGDFSRELNEQFKYVTDPIATRDSKRRDWERFQNAGSGSVSSTLGPSTDMIAPGYAQVSFLRYWTLTQREERSVGEGRRKKSGWRETTMRGVFGSSAGYWPHRQRFVPESGQIVDLPKPADPLQNRTFATPKLLEGGLTPVGAAKTRWSFVFGNGTFTWNHNDVTESGTYTLAGNRVTLTRQDGTTFVLNYDDVTGFLCNKEASYHPVVTPIPGK